MKNESLKVDFYCEEEYQNRVPEPIESSKSFPKWFTELPYLPKHYTFDGNIYNLKIDESTQNIKKCPGIQDFLKTGYLIPSWCDFVFREEESGSLYVNWVENYHNKTEYSPHHENQYSTMPNKPLYGHFGKIFTPWIIKTSPGVSCLITHPVWHNDKRFTTATGVFHTDVSPMQLPWFFEWNHKIETKMEIENLDVENQVISKGEPIIMIVPFYRKKFSSEVHYISEKEYNGMIASQAHLTHDTVGGKCPYTHFKKTLGKLFS